MADEVKTGTMIKKYMVGIFIDTSESGDGTGYKRIKKSTELEIATEANTEEFDFIADVNPSELVKNYKISLSQDLVMIQGQDDFEYFFDKFYNLPVAPEVKAKAMIVFMFKGDKTSGYKAWQTEASVMYDNMNGVDGKLNFTLNFGNIELGIAKMSSGTPTFEKAGTMSTMSAKKA